MADRNLLLGRGEKLALKTPFKNGGGDKTYPYTFDEVRERLDSELAEVEDSVSKLESDAKPRGEAIFELVLHPSFIAKSYYPDALLRTAGMRDVGSKEVVITPNKVTRKSDHGKELGTASLYVAGGMESIKVMRSILQNGMANKGVKKEICEIEKIRWVSSDDKYKGKLGNDSETVRLYEVALHAGHKEEDIVDAFVDYVKKRGGEAVYRKKIQIGALTFFPLKATEKQLREILKFSFIRVAREMPQLRAAMPNAMRSPLDFPDIKLPSAQAIEQEFRVAIFDGGLGSADLSNWADEIVWDDTESTNANYIMHGNEVTSTFLFGRISGDSDFLKQPYANVDHYRVISPSSGSDPDLYDVLLKIIDVLDAGDYKFVNLSLGPRMPIYDDEVHAWTACLDQLCVRHGILMTVAAGNDGDIQGADRIQPPGDMVNAMAIGSCDLSGETWNRASYSCVGPGRSPGYVKPDGVAYGGSDEELFKVYNPFASSVVGVKGTSYSAPLVLRAAAGLAAISDYDMSSIAIKSLLVHTAGTRYRMDRREVGWGRFKENPVEILECEEGFATIIFQGKLEKNEFLRCPIPFPDAGLDAATTIKATFCIQSHTDPEHLVNYTRSGLGVSFRPLVGIGDESTKGFFGMGSQYKKTEREYRDDAHKWETCLHNSHTFKAETQLVDPVFDIQYFARETSRSVAMPSAPDVAYALVISVKIEGVSNVYDLIRQKYDVLEPVAISIDVDADVQI
ncbi:S8 family peptidase [Halomonas hibernica]|uniref:S8 family peptidase n=1 Tax=Halomonas hibernica TaxID=2591147 RepID=UPI0015530422|nr:S8 family peptidase [Halomonas hibernica]